MCRFERSEFLYDAPSKGDWELSRPPAPNSTMLFRVKWLAISTARKGSEHSRVKKIPVLSGSGRQRAMCAIQLAIQTDIALLAQPFIQKLLEKAAVLIT